MRTYARTFAFSLDAIIAELAASVEGGAGIITRYLRVVRCNNCLGPGFFRNGSVLPLAAAFKSTGEFVWSTKASAQRKVSPPYSFAPHSPSLEKRQRFWASQKG